MEKPLDPPGAPRVRGLALKRHRPAEHEIDQRVNPPGNVVFDDHLAGRLARGIRAAAAPKPGRQAARLPRLVVLRVSAVRWLAQLVSVVPPEPLKPGPRVTLMCLQKSLAHGRAQRGGFRLGARARHGEPRGKADRGMAAAIAALTLGRGCASMRTKPGARSWPRVANFSAGRGQRKICEMARFCSVSVCIHAHTRRTSDRCTAQPHKTLTKTRRRKNTKVVVFSGRKTIALPGVFVTLRASW